MADKKILLFAVLLLAACTADPAMDGADGGNSSANTAAAAKLINTPYAAKQGSLTRSGIAPVDEVLQGLEITSLRRVFPYTPRHEERTRAAGLHKWYVVTFDEQADLEAAALKLAAVAEVRNVEFNTQPRGGSTIRSFPASGTTTTTATRPLPRRPAPGPTSTPRMPGRSRPVTPAWWLPSWIRA